MKALAPEVTVVSQVLRIPRQMIRPFADQPRKYFDEQKLRELAGSLKVAGQIMPAIVKPLENDTEHKFELVEGQRRWHATEIAGIPYLDAVLNTDIRSVREHYEKSAIANFCKEPHTPIEIMKIMIRFRDATQPPRSQVEIARLLGCNQTTVSHYLSLENLAPELLSRLDPQLSREDRLSTANAIRIARMPKDLQLKASKIVRAEGLNFRETRHLIQRMADKAGVIITRKSHGPRKDYRRFRGFLDRTKSDAHAVLGRSEDFLSMMFLNRQPTDRKQAVKDLEEIIFLLEEIAKQLEKKS